VAEPTPTPSRGAVPVPAEPAGHGLLEGRTVLVTAAAGTGIGSATARRCLLEGARVAISDVHERRLGETARALEDELGVEVPTFVCNVTDQEQVTAMVEGTIAALGRLDVLVNNAGLGGTASILEMTDQQWSSVLDVTLTGTFRVTRAVLPHMVERGSGVIVNNASVIGWRAQAEQSHYAAAKAGVMAFTRCTALDVARSGVRINAVAPSIAMHKFLAKVTSDELLDRLSDGEAFGRAAEPWEVANTIVYLASDYASYLTGEVVSVSSQHP
jgi:3-oxoacyl-[acyl-carrier protein] reductase